MLVGDPPTLRAVRAHGAAGLHPDSGASGRLQKAPWGGAGCGAGIGFASKLILPPPMTSSVLVSQLPKGAAEG